MTICGISTIILREMVSLHKNLDTEVGAHVRLAHT